MAVTLLLLYGRELTALFEEGVQAVEVAAQLLVKALRKTDKYLRFWKQRTQVRRATETWPLNSASGIIKASQDSWFFYVSGRRCGLQ
jgi:hypothetical protein